jgi:hypothetical protein
MGGGVGLSVESVVRIVDEKSEKTELRGESEHSILDGLISACMQSFACIHVRLSMWEDGCECVGARRLVQRVEVRLNPIFEGPGEGPEDEGAIPRVLSEEGNDVGVGAGEAGEVG